MKLGNHISKNNSGFSTPKSYFEDFDNRLMQRIASNEKDNTTHLPKESGFQIPEAYFDAVEKSILEQTVQAKTAKVFNLWYYQLAKVAAVLLIIITGYGILTVSNKSTSTEDGFSKLSETDLENYIEHYIFPYSEMRNLYISESDFELADNQLENLNQNAILDYLDNELDELDLIDK